MPTPEHICPRCGTIYSCKCTLDEIRQAEWFLDSRNQRHHHLRVKRSEAKTTAEKARLVVEIARVELEVRQKIYEWRK